LRRLRGALVELLAELGLSLSGNLLCDLLCLIGRLRGDVLRLPSRLLELVLRLAGQGLVLFRGHLVFSGKGVRLPEWDRQVHRRLIWDNPCLGALPRCRVGKRFRVPQLRRRWDTAGVAASLLRAAVALRDSMAKTPRANLEARMDLFDLQGKVAVVTGGTSGIGLMIAAGLVQAGASVYVSSRKAQAGEDAVRELSVHGRASSIPADLSREEECLRLASEVAEREGALHILVNNAGATWGEPLEGFPAAAWDRALDLNLKAPFFLTRALLSLLEAGASAEDPARVINVGSIDGLRVPELPTYSYSASKAALHQLTRVLARELGPRHVTVNAIAPGPFPSRMMAATLDAFGDHIAAGTPLRRIGRPDDMAGTAIYLASRAGAYVTGAIIPVDGGILVSS
jgi:NAD(P)-dependent dehydrogenase (short-subunit alcohol dehydrogenase family)